VSLGVIQKKTRKISLIYNEILKRIWEKKLAPKYVFPFFGGGKNQKLGTFNQRVDTHVNLITTVLKKKCKKNSKNERFL